MTTLERVIRHSVDYLKDDTEGNERAVELRVVVPLLRALGWRDGDPCEMIPQYNVEAGTVDWALCQKNKPVFLIEVKAANQRLSMHEDQLEQYVRGTGVTLAALTNGAEWWLYRCNAKTKWPQRRFAIIRLEAADCARQLEAYLGKKQVVSGKAYSDAERLHRQMITEGRLLPQVQSALAQLLREPTPEFIGQLREFVQERAGLNATPEIMKKALHALMEPPHEAPAHVKPESASIEGNSLTVQNWIDVLVGTAKWLLRQGKQLPVDKKLPGRGGRVLISRQPNRLKSAKQIAKDLYIEANWSAEGCVNCARWLLESCGYSRGDLVVTPRIA